MNTVSTIRKCNRVLTRVGFAVRVLVSVVLTATSIGCEDPTGPVPLEFEIVDLGAYARCEGDSYRCRSEAYDVNNAGQVIGFFPAASGWDSYSFLWHEGSVQEIGGWDAAIDINDAGRIVGRSGLWEDGSWTDFGEFFGMAINEDGQVAGSGTFVVGETEWGDPAYESHAALLLDDDWIDLGTLGGTWSSATAINDHSQVVGFSTTIIESLEWGEQVRGFLWENGVMTDLGASGGNISYAMDINNSRQVVGWFDTGYDWDTMGARGFLWENGEMTALATLGGDVAHAFGVNEAGDIVGGSTTAAGEYHAVLWSGGEILDLGTLDGYAVSQAYKINDSGMIVGYCEAPGQRRATMWRRR